MGFGKTYTALPFLSYYVLHVTPTNGFHPHLIVVPSSIVLDQWLNAIYDKFPGLTVVLAHGERPTKAIHAKNWISATAMREAPESGKFPKSFEVHV
jgi:SNF2 family DNA or RNA helicase